MDFGLEWECWHGRRTTDPSNWGTWLSLTNNTNRTVI